MFRIKICGIADSEAARVACEAGADAVGLNFYAGSPRCVTLEKAQEIAAEVGDKALMVGVFVNASAAEIGSLCEQVPLDAIQLHGDEPPSFLNELPAVPVLKAFRCGAAGLAPLVKYLADCETQGRLPDALLIDAQVPGEYGGSGQTVDWTPLPDARDKLHGLPVILAGGLKATNVAEAIAVARPDGVDVASGVESSPGMKDARLVHAFVGEARAANWPE